MGFRCCTVCYSLQSHCEHWVFFGAGNLILYVALTAELVGIRCLVGPGLVSLMMRIQWVAEQEEPELHQMIADLPVRTFFLNDVAPAAQDIGNLRELDQDLSGTIEHAELTSMRCKAVSFSHTQRLLEVFTAHPLICVNASPPLCSQDGFPATSKSGVATRGTVIVAMARKDSD